MSKRRLGERIRVAYQTWEPETEYSEGIYRLKISWNQYQSSLSKLKRKPRLGRLVTVFGENAQLTLHTLENGVGAYNEHSRFITIQANDKKRANSCSRELGLQPFFIGRRSHPAWN